MRPTATRRSARARSIAAAIANLRELVAFIVRSATTGDAAQQAVLARGDTAIYERDLAYLERLQR